MLSMIEDAPPLIKLATLVVPVLAFLVIQFEAPIRKINRDLYPIILVLLIVSFAGFGAYVHFLVPYHPPAAPSEAELAEKIKAAVDPVQTNLDAATKQLGIITNENTDLKSKLDTKTQELGSATKQHTDLKSKLDSAIHERDSAKRESDEKSAELAKQDLKIKELQQDLETASKAKPTGTDTTSGADTTYVPTHLKLQFNAADITPVELDKANVQWSSVTYAERVAQKCGVQWYQNLVPLYVCEDILNPTDKDYVTRKVTIVMLSFDKPISYRNVVVDFHEADFHWTRLDIHPLGKQERFTTVSLWPNLAHVVVDIDMKP